MKINSKFNVLNLSGDQVSQECSTILQNICTWWDGSMHHVDAYCMEIVNK